jgi:hypothetical protein
MCSLIIYPGTGSRSCCRKPVYGNPGENFVVGPRVGVGPVMEFLVDPGEECDWGIGEGVADGLGFCALEEVVAVGFFAEPGCTL